MHPRKALRDIWKAEIRELKKIFGENSKNIDIIEEEGPMTWEEAMSEPLYLPIELDIGGEMEIKINHNKEIPLFKGTQVYL